jgi:hypothetical protein
MKITCNWSRIYIVKSLNWCINIYSNRYPKYKTSLIRRWAWRYQRGNQNPYIEEEQTGQERWFQFSQVRVTRSLPLLGSCICMFCRSLFVLLYFFFWPLCCLFFFDIRILITPLISWNSSFSLICSNIPAAPAFGVYLCIYISLRLYDIPEPVVPIMILI